MSTLPTLRNIFTVIGVIALCVLIWFAGPLLAIGETRPLDGMWERVGAIALVVAIALTIAAVQHYQKRKAAVALERGIAGAEDDTSDALVLQETMNDALATLRRATGPKGDYLYDLPWYVIIGPPGSGKTTALVNSGLPFPLSRGATPAAVAGTGGTRYCDWWFTEEAVLIDTAGRYTTQDSDAKADKRSWLSFLDLLKKNRPRQPINGVIIAISLQDVLTLAPDQIAAHAQAIRSRLLDIHNQLKIDFPVYALFTKADLVAGFVEFFAYLDEQGRQQVWGATFQTTDKKKNLVGEIPAEFDALIASLNERMPDRLQEEPAPGPRVALYGFPAQIAALKRPIHNFLNAI